MNVTTDQPNSNPNAKENKAREKKIFIIIISILFWPIGIIWWIWHRPNTDRRIQVFVTALTIILLMVGISLFGGSPSTVQPVTTTAAPVVVNSNTPALSSPTPAATPIALVFNITPLVGKTIDQVKSSIPGKPTDDTEPTAVQKTSIPTWDKSWHLGDHDVLVTYTISTRKVTDFFVDAQQNDSSDNELILKTQFGVTNSSPAYSVTFVKGIKDNSLMTGMKVTVN